MSLLFLLTEKENQKENEMKFLCDVESYQNVFIVSVKNYDTGEKKIFEISERRNDIEEIKKWFGTFKGFLITFNGIHYDVPMILYLCLNRFENWYDCTYALKQWSDKIISKDLWWKEYSLKRYKYHDRWIDVDIYLYWSKMTRLSKKISLKGLAIQMNYPVIQELPFHPDSILDKEQIDELIRYNSIHDLDILEWILKKPCKLQGKKTTMYEQVEMRADAYRKYNFKKQVFSWDGVKLGLNILVKSYAEKTWTHEHMIEKEEYEKEIWNMRGSFEPLKMSDIILETISFEKTSLNYKYKGNTIIPNSFHSLLQHLKSRTVSNTNELDYTVILNGVKYDVKSGGLHSWHNNEIVCPDKKRYIYRDADVSSYYPSLGATYSFTPEHLKGMDLFLNDFRLERLADKKAGRKAEERLKKLALNGGYYGNLNQEHTPMYYPKGLLSTTVNGQLFLLMLCERFENVGIKVDMVNTDGVTAIVPLEKENLYMDICKEWEDITKMELEYQDFEKVIRSNINNYLAITTEGEVKEKGMFVTEPDFGGRVDFLIIPKALKEWYVNGIEPEEFIMNHDNIFDFCGSQKVDRSFKVIWNDTECQNLNRYYIRKNSPYLYKSKKGSMQHMMKGHGVSIYNNHEERKMEEYDIDYKFYVSKVKNIIKELNSNNQLNLFA